MDYEGIVYRPPSEARSLIIQVTIGCAHNTCGFCNMYKEKKFRIRSLAEILADLTEVSHNPYAPYIEKVFLADGDALVMKTEDLLVILDAIHRLYPGADSGDNEILKYINKGVTAEQTIEAGQKLKRCGIATSVTLISGLGGRSKVEEHALSCAKLITAMNPEYASFLTLRLYEGTPMYADVVEGRFQRITPDEIVDEMEIFLKNVDSPGTVFRTNHASNYVILAGTLNGDIPAMLKKLEEAKRTHHYRKFRETGDLL